MSSEIDQIGYTFKMSTEIQTFSFNTLNISI